MGTILNVNKSAWLSEMEVTPYVLKASPEYVFSAEMLFQASIFPWVIADAADASRQTLLGNILFACKLSMAEVNLFRTDVSLATAQTIGYWQSELLKYQPKTIFAFGQQAGSLFFKGEVLESKWGIHQVENCTVVYGPSLQILSNAPAYKRQVWHDLAQTL